jgi:hypothetical protein
MMKIWKILTNTVLIYIKTKTIAEGILLYFKKDAKSCLNTLTRLQALPEVERERILAERSEERQRNLERLEVRKLLKDGRREDATRSNTTKSLFRLNQKLTLQYRIHTCKRKWYSQCTFRINETKRRKE